MATPASNAGSATATNGAAAIGGRVGLGDSTRPVGRASSGSRPRAFRCAPAPTVLGAASLPRSRLSRGPTWGSARGPPGTCHGRACAMLGGASPCGHGRHRWCSCSPTFGLRIVGRPDVGRSVAAGPPPHDSAPSESTARRTPGPASNSVMVRRKRHSPRLRDYRMVHVPASHGEGSGQSAAGGAFAAAEGGRRFGSSPRPGARARDERSNHPTISRSCVLPPRERIGTIRCIDAIRSPRPAGCRTGARSGSSRPIREAHGRGTACSSASLACKTWSCHRPAMRSMARPTPSARKPHLAATRRLAVFSAMMFA